MPPRISSANRSKKPKPFSPRAKLLSTNPSFTWGPIGFCYYIHAALAYVESPRASRDIECLFHLARVIEERLGSDLDEITHIVPLLVDFCNARGNHDGSNRFKALAFNLQRLSTPATGSYPAPVVMS